MTFIQVFSIEKRAIEFAKQNSGKIFIKYDWDEVHNRMIKYYIVKY